eukprot:734566-Lingulodinium_polyedra.AAC.1
MLPRRGCRRRIATPRRHVAMPMRFCSRLVATPTMPVPPKRWSGVWPTGSWCHGLWPVRKRQPLAR